MKTESISLFLELYEKLEASDNIKSRIESMIKHRERKIYDLPLTMSEKLQVMKLSNITAIYGFMKKQYEKEKISYGKTYRCTNQ